MKLKNILGSSVKTIKGESRGYLTGILYLAPHSIVDGLNLCRFASKECKRDCLYSAGRGAFKSVQTARINKTILFRDNPSYFLACLVYSIKALVRKSERLNLIPVVRLNGTSDISWEGVYFENKTIFQHFPSLQFYDYTKNHTRCHALSGNINNYHLTYSFSGHNYNQCIKLIGSGVNVAMLFNSLPNKFEGREVIDGDETDLRFLDKKGVIVGLIPKGKARKTESKFIINNTNEVQNESHAI